MHAGGRRFDPAWLHQITGVPGCAEYPDTVSVCRNKCFGVVTKPFFLITGSELLFNNSDEIETRGLVPLSRNKDSAITIKRYPVCR